MPKGDDDETIGQWQCTYKNCGEMFQTEQALTKHLLRDHKSPNKNPSMMREGTDTEGFNTTEINDAGFEVPRNKKSLDMMNTLRRILTNNGIRDRREAIVEMFEYENPEDTDALDRILAMADINVNKRKFIVALWSKFINSLTGEDVEPSKITKEKLGKRKSIMDITPEEMMDWGPGEYAQYMMELQKYNSARNMQMEMFKQMFGVGGIKGDEKAAKIDPDTQARLDKLRAYEDQEKLNKMMEPIVKELRYLRAEQEDRKDKKSPIEDIKELAMMKQLMDSLGSKEGSEILRMQMDERIEKMRIEAQRETERLRLESERAKEDNRRLEIKNVETAMGAKIDNLKAALDLASQTKKDDLMTTIKQAQEITTAMKNLTGDVETPDDKKMKMIASVVDSAVQTLKPVAVELARNVGNRGTAPPQYAPPGMVPPMPRPPQQMQGQYVMAKCPTEGCGFEFNVDVSKESAECPSCHTRYNVQPMAPPQVVGGSMPSMGGGRISTDQRKSVLRQLPREELEAAARQLGLTPELYRDTDSLIDDMLRSSGHV